MAVKNNSERAMLAIIFLAALLSAIMFLTEAKRRHLPVAETQKSDVKKAETEEDDDLIWIMMHLSE